MSFTIGSLFDGSGGFPLAATMCGGTPVWASEVEPFPIAVTWSRFPGMKHLGSVTDIKGGEIEPVDIITFGSPCQDLSVAGKRAGLKHEDNGDEETTRSGLFMEAIRIIKEMRRATNGVYPRFAVWENVPGAFSSNKGEDFRTVLEELIKIVEPSAVMPPVPKNGWPYADCYCGDGWSLAYRTFDAQYWGVPQRRRRIYLVADFRGECAGKILFERQGLRGYFTEGRTPWQGVAGDAESGSGAADCEGKCYSIDKAITTGGNCTAGGSCVAEDISQTLTTDRPRAVCYGIVSKGNGEAWPIEEKHMALSCGGGQAGQGYPCVMLPVDFDTYNMTPTGDKTVTLPAGSECNYPDVTDSHILDDQGGQQITVRTDGISPTLRAEMHGNVPCILEPHTYDARGNGNGTTVNTITGDHENRITDYTSLVMEAVGFDMYNQQVTGDVSRTIKTPVGGDDLPVVFCCIDGDKIGKAERAGGSGLGIREGDKMYTLTSKDAGSHAVVYACSSKQQSLAVSEDKANTLGANDYKEPKVVAYGINGDVAATLDASYYKGCGMRQGVEREVVAYCVGNGQPNQISMAEQANTLDCMHDQQAVVYVDTTHADDVVRCDDVTAPLQARDYKGGGLVVFDKELYNSGINATGAHYIDECGIAPTLRATGHPPGVGYQYIVRRLTPTECARLQGFADRWAVPDHKEDFTDEEYRFWCDVYRTKLLIDGKVEFDDEGVLVHTTSRKPFNDKTKPQMVTWYNKLHTDSSEYKLWGNGIAFPNALYVMQGIADVLNQ